MVPKDLELKLKAIYLFTSPWAYPCVLFGRSKKDVIVSLDQPNVVKC